MPIITPNLASLSTLLGDSSQVAAAGSSTLGILTFVQKEAQLLSGGNPGATNLWAVQCQGKASRLIVAGDQKIENAFHAPLEQGRLLETQIGEAMAWIMAKKLDYEEKIKHYLSLNTLAIDGKLSDIPRAIKYSKDSIDFVKQIQTYTNDTLQMVQAIQVNLALAKAAEGRIVGMIQANTNALGQLLAEICNWGLPGTLSMLMRLGNWNWDGFNFNPITGFKFNTGLNFNLNFSFSQCIPRETDFSSLFTDATSVIDGTVTATLGQPILPAGQSYGDPTQFSDPAYVATMQSTTSAVFDPSQPVAAPGSSLPLPSSIISNYSLTPTDYAANIVSTVPALLPVVTDQSASLRSLLIENVSLHQVVSSGYDPNMTAAWIFYLSLNRRGRAGNWFASFEAAYDEFIAPSIAYLATTPVPWNEVLGGAGLQDAPVAIPLIAELQADTTQNLLWKLSYIEAALLGYVRDRTWDAGADAVYTASFSGTDLDYVATVVNAAPTGTVVLGGDTATYPTSCTYPQSIGGVLAATIQLAAARILNAPSFQSTRPQFRYVYDAFAEATLVDRFSQFWREFSANLATLLQQDPYLVGFAVTYPELLASAIDPLAGSSLYIALQGDVASRNRAWTPGAALLPIPAPLSLLPSSTGPTATTNGWNGDTFDAAAFLARPDIQAQTLPTQIAMLRTNQSYANLLILQSNVQAAFAAMIANAQAATASAGMPGWQVETGVSIAVPAGSQGYIVPFSQVDFDQTGYIEDNSTIKIPTSGVYLLNAVLNWDPSGISGTRTITFTQNGDTIAVASATSSDDDPFTVQFSTQVSLSQGDELQVQASHSLGVAQQLLAGCNFLGLLNSSSSSTSAPTGSQTDNSGSVPFTSGTNFPPYSAVSQKPDGRVYPVDPSSLVVGAIPFVDGLALAASTGAGELISVGTTYGGVYSTPGTNWTVGSLLYVAADGTLTQDYTTLTATVRWIVCVGKAITETAVLYEPHIPTNYIQNF